MMNVLIEFDKSLRSLSKPEIKNITIGKTSTKKSAFETCICPRFPSNHFVSYRQSVCVNVCFFVTVRDTF